MGLACQIAGLRNVFRIGRISVGAAHSLNAEINRILDENGRHNHVPKILYKPQNVLDGMSISVRAQPKTDQSNCLHKVK